MREDTHLRRETKNAPKVGHTAEEFWHRAKASNRMDGSVNTASGRPFENSRSANSPNRPTVLRIPVSRLYGTATMVTGPLAVDPVAEVLSWPGLLVLMLKALKYGLPWLFTTSRKSPVPSSVML